MSFPHPFATKCAIAVLTAQLFAAPAIADGTRVSSGSFLFGKSNSLGLHYRSTPRVHRHYVAPKVYHHKAKPKVYHYKAKPKVHHVKPVKKHHRSGFGHFKKRTPYYLPRRYGIQQRHFRRGFSRYKY